MVAVRPAANNSIEAYVDEAVQHRKAQGWKADWGIDAETRSALIVFSLEGNNTNQVELQKTVLSANQVYTLTTGRMLDQVVANAQAKLDITSILNSFRVL